MQAKKSTCSKRSRTLLLGNVEQIDVEVSINPTHNAVPVWLAISRVSEILAALAIVNGVIQHFFSYAFRVCSNTVSVSCQVITKPHVGFRLGLATRIHAAVFPSWQSKHVSSLVPHNCFSDCPRSVLRRFVHHLIFSHRLIFESQRINPSVDAGRGTESNRPRRLQLHQIVPRP